LVVACAVTAAPAQTSNTFDLTGNWKTRLGPIELTQRAESVAGTFVWKEAGEFTGNLDGIWLSGRWKTLSGSQSGTWRLEVMTGANRLVGKSTPDDGGEIVNFSAVRAELLTRRSSRDIAPAESGDSDDGITGWWAGSLGEFTLRQEGDLLTGLFDWDGGGRITGRRDGDDFRGEWYGRDGISSGRWHGQVDPQSRTLAGTWIHAAGGVHNWTAQRSDGAGEAGVSEGHSPPGERFEPGFTGQWRSRFGNFRLTEALQIVAGRFEWEGGGTLSGTVVNGAASGTWRSDDGSRVGAWSLRSLLGGRILQGSLTTAKPEAAPESWTAVRIE
jgi:hypothetical protein